jgi:uncharacterized protein (TIGR02145 family)
MKKLILLLTGLVFITVNNQAQTVTDIDSNVYNTVTIGTQTWMAENLKTTKYNDNTAIPYEHVIPFDINYNPAYCFYSNDTIIDKAPYGALYTFFTVKTGKLCPSGWHVPTDDEWTILENYLLSNGYNYDGKKRGYKYAKALASDSGWKSSTKPGAVGNTDYPDKRNASGFKALPGGVCYGGFSFIGQSGYWWSSTPGDGLKPFNRFMGYDDSSLSRGNGTMFSAQSVRCLKNK